MDFLTALITEKWLLAAALFLWAWLERQERHDDKKSLSEERKAITQAMTEMTEALIVIKERIGK